MNEITRPLKVIEAEINFYKGQTATGIIEIGKRLIEAKEQLPHGEWGKWLAEKVEFSQVTASRFMRAAKECGNFSALKDLEPTKVYALLDLPPDEREEFVETVHEVNGEMKTIDIMSTREVQQLIKEKKELEQAKAELEQQKKELEEERAGLEADLDVVLNREAYAKQRLKEKDEAIARVINTKTEKVVEKAPEDYERIRQENEKLKEQNKTLLDQKQQVTRQLQETKALYTDIVNLTEFRTSIGSFLDKMAKYTYYAEAFGLLEPRQQTEFHSQVDKIEEWCKEVRQAIKGIKTEKSILVEGGYRVE
jgi:DNA repair exonuclease SbcCD ATPase subunit